MRLSQSLVIALALATPAFPQCPAGPWTFNIAGSGNTYVGQMRINPVSGNRSSFTAAMTSTGTPAVRADAVNGSFFWLDANCASGFFFLNYDGISTQLDVQVVNDATFGRVIQFRPPNADPATTGATGNAWPAPNGCPTNLPSLSALFNGTYRGFSGTSTVTVASSAAGGATGTLTAVVVPPLGAPNPGPILPVPPGTPITFPTLSPNLQGSGVYEVASDCVRNCVFIYLPDGIGYWLDVYPRVQLSGAITFVGAGNRFNGNRGFITSTITR